MDEAENKQNKDLERVLAHSKPFRAFPGSASLSSGSESAHAGRRVLIIDENARMSATLDHILADYGCTLHQVNDAISGLCETGEFLPAVIFIEAFALKLDAFQFVQLLGKYRSGHGIKIVLMLDRDDIFLKARAEALGAGFLVRPFSGSDLLKLLSLDVDDKSEGLEAVRPSGSTDGARPAVKPKGKEAA